MLADLTVRGWFSTLGSIVDLILRPNTFYEEHAEKTTAQSEMRLIGTAGLMIVLLSTFRPDGIESTMTRIGLDFGVLNAQAESLAIFIVFIALAAAMAVVEFIGIFFGGRILFRDYLFFRIHTLFYFYLVLLAIGVGPVALWATLNTLEYHAMGAWPAIYIKVVAAACILVFGFLAPFAVCRRRLAENGPSIWQGLRLTVGYIVIAGTYFGAALVPVTPG